MGIQIIGERPVIDVSSGVSAGRWNFREETTQEIIEHNRWRRLEAMLEGAVRADQQQMEGWLETQPLEVTFGAQEDAFPGSIYDLVSAVRAGDLLEAQKILRREERLAWERYKLAAEADAHR